MPLNWRFNRHRTVPRAEMWGDIKDPALSAFTVAQRREIADALDITPPGASPRNVYEAINTEASSHRSDEPIDWVSGPPPFISAPALGGAPRRFSMGRVLALAAIVIVVLAALGYGISVAVSGGDDTNVRKASAEALNGIPADSNDAAIHTALDAKLDGDDLTTVEAAVKEARSRNVSLPQIAAALALGDGDDRKDAAEIIKAAGSQVANPTGTQTGAPTGTQTAPAGSTTTPTPGSSAEQIKAEILRLIDQKILQAQNENKALLESLRRDIDARTAQSVAEQKAFLEQLVKSIQVVPNAPATPPPGKTAVPSNGGGQTTMTKCGPLTWGPAGQAPGTGTTDSAKQVSDAVQAMQVDLNSAQHVTIHKFCPGDDTPNGWIVGSSWTEANGVNVKANMLPAGVCVDYDPGATKITGDVYHTQVLTPRWSRTQLKGDGSASGLKFTVYWTPCAFTDGTPSWPGNDTLVQPASAAPAGCPATANDVAVLTKTPATWNKLGNEPCAWLYNGTAVSFTVPKGYEVDYDAGGRGGKKFEGETVPSGIVFTFRLRG